MPVNYKIDGKTAVITATGDVLPREIQGAFENLFQDPDFKNGLNILVYDKQSSYNPDTFAIVNAADHMDSLMKMFSPKIALVVNSDLKYGFGRMLEMYCDVKNIELQVFKELDQAKSWLETDKVIS